MKKSELRQLIREELENIQLELNEQSLESQFNDLRIKINAKIKEISKGAKSTMGNITKEFIRGTEKEDALGDLKALYNELEKLEV